MNDFQKAESAVLSTPEKVPIIMRPKLVYEASELRDPFDDFLPKAKPKAGTKGPGFTTEMAVPLPSFQVQGLVWGGSLPQAIVDNQVVKVGDIIQEAEIVEISKEGIKVLFNKKIYKLSPPGLAGADISNKPK